MSADKPPFSGDWRKREKKLNLLHSLKLYKYSYQCIGESSLCLVTRLPYFLCKDLTWLYNRWWIEIIETNGVIKTNIRTLGWGKYSQFAQKHWIFYAPKRLFSDIDPWYEFDRNEFEFKRNDQFKSTNFLQKFTQNVHWLSPQKCASAEIHAISRYDISLCH